MKKRSSLDLINGTGSITSGTMANGTGFDNNCNSKTPSLIYLISLNALACGMEFCVSAGFAYVPPLLLKLGFSESAMTCLMGIGPFVALSIVPVLGSYSDTYRSRFGRRRPFILVLSLLVLLSLILIPFGELFGRMLSSRTTGIVITAFGIILLDFSSLCCLNPSESLVSDSVRGTKHTKKAFTVQSCMLSVGGCIGFLITSTDWSETVLSKFFKTQEQIAFVVIFILLIFSLSITMLVAKENSLLTCAKLPSPDSLLVVEDGGYDSASSDVSEDSNRSSPKRKSTAGYISLKSLPHFTTVVTGSLFLLMKRIRSVLHAIILTLNVIICTPLRIISGIRTAPIVLRRLFMADFCSWAGILCLSMFYTDYIAQGVFRGDPSAKEGTIARLRFDTGVRRGSWDLLMHNIIALLYATFIQNHIVHKYGIRYVYLSGLFTFSLSMLGILCNSNLFVVSACTAMSGIGFATITSVPNTLVTGYQNDTALYFFDVKSDGDRGMASDIAVLNSAYYLAQITLALGIGVLVDTSGTVTSYIIVACAFGCLAFSLGSRIIFTVTDAKKLQGIC
uniref:Membrane-associated transporter protein n=1 Tax=Strigamia maritima TaxID=126957 RepID=T1JEX0_STRMM